MTTVKPAGDFYAPAYRIAFYRPSTAKTSTVEGKSVGDVVITSSADANEDPSKSTISFKDGENTSVLRPFVSQVVIEGVNSSAYRVTVTLRPPYEAAVQILENKVIQFGSVMQIQWGYFTGNEPIISSRHSFRITQPQASFGSDITITIVGQDFFTAAAEDRSHSQTWSNYKTGLALIERIVHEMGTNLKLVTTDVPNKADARWFVEESDKTWEQRGSYWHFFVDVCKAYGVGWKYSGDEIRLYDREFMASRPPAYRIMWRTPPIDKNDIVAKSVTINPLITAFQGGAVTRGVLMTKTNNATNVTTQVHIDDTNTPGRIAPGASALTSASPAADSHQAVDLGGITITPSPALPDGAAGEHIPVASRARRGRARVEDVVRTNSEFTNITAAVTIPGHPAIEPQMIVTVVGLPNIFAGNYLIRSVKHILGEGYTTELDLYARSSSLDPRGEGEIATTALNRLLPNATMEEVVVARTVDGVVDLVNSVGF